MEQKSKTLDEMYNDFLECEDALELYNHFFDVIKRAFSAGYNIGKAEYITSDVTRNNNS